MTSTAEDPRARGLLSIATFVLGWAASALVVRVAYGPDLFAAWPWVRATGVLSVVSALCGVLSARNRLHPLAGTRSSSEDALLFLFAVIPGVAILLYPGASRLGLASDDQLTYWGLAVMAVQATVFFAMRGLNR